MVIKLSKIVKKGILQGYLLTPLLFFISLELICRLLSKLTSIKLRDNNVEIIFVINHLSFIDDIKIFSFSKSETDMFTEKCKLIMRKIGLELNNNKVVQIMNLN